MLKHMFLLLVSDHNNDKNCIMTVLACSDNTFTIFENFKERYNNEYSDEVTLLDWADSQSEWSTRYEEEFTYEAAYINFFTQPYSGGRSHFNRFASNNIRLVWNFNDNTITQTIHDAVIRRHEVDDETSIRNRYINKKKKYYGVKQMITSLKFW